MSLLGSISELVGGGEEGGFGQKFGALSAIARVGGTLANVVLSTTGSGKPQTQGIISTITGATTFAPPGAGAQVFAPGPGGQVQVFLAPAPNPTPVGPALGGLETRFFGAPAPAPARGIGRDFFTEGDAPTGPPGGFEPAGFGPGFGPGFGGPPLPGAFALGCDHNFRCQ